MRRFPLGPDTEGAGSVATAAIVHADCEWDEILAGFGGEIGRDQNDGLASVGYVLTINNQ